MWVGDRVRARVATTPLTFDHPGQWLPGLLAAWTRRVGTATLRRVGHPVPLHRSLSCQKRGAVLARGIQYHACNLLAFLSLLALVVLPPDFVTGCNSSLLLLYLAPRKTRCHLLWSGESRAKRAPCSLPAARPRAPCVRPTLKDDQVCRSLAG